MEWLSAPSRTHLAESQILRAGPFRRSPIWIHSPIRTQDPGIYLFRPAGLCNYLTVRRLVPDFQLKTIWLLPEFVGGAGHSLTHLWIPERQMLVFYLCPLRIYGSTSGEQELEKPAGSYSVGNIPMQRLETIRNGQIPAGRMKQPRPLLDSVLGSIGEKPEVEHGLGKFLIPDSVLSPRELADMERISDSWKKALIERRNRY
ncbi:MAG: hypothetical protein CMF59_16115 [Leptospiraceae bacterium]|nr:hypothetical protein [Leptospiraceae bacterium]